MFALPVVLVSHHRFLLIFYGLDIGVADYRLEPLLSEAPGFGVADLVNQTVGDEIVGIAVMETRLRTGRGRRPDSRPGQSLWSGSE